jgi:hypothetical protein
VRVFQAHTGKPFGVPAANIRVSTGQAWEHRLAGQSARPGGIDEFDRLTLNELVGQN